MKDNKQENIQSIRKEKFEKMFKGENIEYSNASFE